MTPLPASNPESDVFTSTFPLAHPVNLKDQQLSNASSPWLPVSTEYSKGDLGDAGRKKRVGTGEFDTSLQCQLPSSSQTLQRDS